MITFDPPIPQREHPTYKVFVSSVVFIGTLRFSDYDNEYGFKPDYPKDRAGISGQSLMEIWNAIKTLNERK